MILLILKMNYMNIFCYSMIWPCIYSLFTNIEPKLRRNNVSFFHSVGSSLLTGISLYNNEQMLKPIILFSGTYFIWDTFYIFYNKKWNEYLYIYHHFVVLYMLYELYITHLNIYIDLLHIGEVSNYFNYIVYILINTENKVYISNRYCTYVSKYKYSNLIDIFKGLQYLWYLYFRVYIYSQYILFASYKITNQLLLLNLYTIYILGLIWTFKLGHKFVCKFIL